MIFKYCSILISRFQSNKFLKDISILSLGTIIGQAILLLFSPILTRLFSPNDFGNLSFFTSIATTIAVFSVGRYDLAIPLPKENKKAIEIIKLIFVLSIGVSILYLILIFVIRQLNIGKSNFKEFIFNDIVFLIPLFTFIVANISSLSAFKLRLKEYKFISFFGILQATSTSLISVFIGYMGTYENGLIWGLMLSQVVCFMFLYFFVILKNKIEKDIHIYSLINIAKEYKKFPRYMLMSDLAATFSQQMVPMVFYALYNSGIVGLFSLANRMLRIPNIVLTSAIANVFRNEAVEQIREKNNCIEIYKSTLKKLVILSLPIYGFVALISPFVFVFCFGEAWKEAGYFAQILCIMLLFDFVVLPLNSLFYIVGKQKNYMILQIFNVVLSAMSIYIGYYIGNSPYYSLLFFSVSGIIVNMVSLSITYNLAKGQKYTSRLLKINNRNGV